MAMISRRAILVAVVSVGGLWFFVDQHNARRAEAAAAAMPVTIRDEVQNLPASSMKAIGLTLPRAGHLEVSLDVRRGNAVNVFLADIYQRELIEKQDWKNVVALQDFNALKTMTYKRTARLEAGGYYLVLRDPTLGILSATSSDIAIKVVLRP